MERATTSPTAEDQHEVGPRPEPGRRLRQGLIGGGIAIALTLAGLGVAAGQSDTTTPTAPPGGGQAPGPELESERGGRGHGGPKHRFGMGIHGEFTTRAPGGGYQTMASQIGEITDAGDTAVTVRSEDGFTRTYAVNDGTLVNAGNNGITDVKQDDSVRVLALVKDGNATAVHIFDETQVRNSREQWAPGRGRPPRNAPAAPGAPD